MWFGQSCVEPAKAKTAKCSGRTEQITNGGGRELSDVKIKN
jgi:hypothetical protein